MKNKKVLFCILIVAIFMFTTFTSAIAVEHAHEHNCIGEHCQICYRVSALKNTLKILSYIFAAPLIFNLFSYLRLNIKLYFTYNYANVTLVTLKEKLTN